MLFTQATFGLAAVMMVGGIYSLEASFSAKGCDALAAIMLVHTSITLTKMLRDNEEASKLISKIEDARTEKMLMAINRG